LLNVSPKGDGAIPEDQQQSLKTVGDWLRVNGEAIYGSSAWLRPGEGPGIPAAAPGDWKGGSTAAHLPDVKRPAAAAFTEADFRFTTANNNLYAFGYKYPEREATIRSLSNSAAKIERVTLLGVEPRQLPFRQSAEALVVTIPPGSQPSLMPYTLRIEGTHALGAT
jgi:alpha-L-fucosidase